MEAERYRRVCRIFEHALILGIEERTRYLEIACSDDSDLRRLVDAALAEARSPEDFLATGQTRELWQRLLGEEDGEPS